MASLKKLLKDLPLIGKLLVKIKQKVSPPPAFIGSANYWEQRYAQGGNSGLGSYNHLAQFKAKVINNLIQKENINSIVELGCGDGNQLKQISASPTYTGFDVSATAIKKCKKIFAHQPNKSFYHMSDWHKMQQPIAQLALSLDVIYHLTENQVYEKYMHQLVQSTSQYILIYASNTTQNNYPSVPHVKPRRFTDWLAINAPEFQLIHHLPNPYPYNGNDSHTSVSDFYLFAKQQIAI